MYNKRVFLFLQGPHGPFFYELGQMLQKAGANVWRVGFNAGDRAFWPHRASYIPFHDPIGNWGPYFRETCMQKDITDIVLYGDSRPIHAEAITQARALGLRIHVFEEGYLRPYWVTYERDGANGNSRLMQMGIAQMTRMLSESRHESPAPPDHWGDMRQHVFYGALYHFFVMSMNGAYPHFVSHRHKPVTQEFKLYLKKLLMMPANAMQRLKAERRIRYGSFPYHLVLLQLEHDSSFRSHSTFASMSEFIALVVENFVKGAPLHHHLVFKAHPLEDEHQKLRHVIRRFASQHDVSERVHYVHGGKLAPLLSNATSAVTVNSTAAQQALWRGIALKVFGSAVYDKPELVSNQTLTEFFAKPRAPDRDAYRTYRRYLLATSQLSGGFYSTRGRRKLLRQAVDLMFAYNDPYDLRYLDNTAHRDHLRLAQSSQ